MFRPRDERVPERNQPFQDTPLRPSLHSHAGNILPGARRKPDDPPGGTGEGVTYFYLTFFQS